MGDRVLVIFAGVFPDVDGNGERVDVSPTVHSHWDGKNMPGLLRTLKSIMYNRDDEPILNAAGNAAFQLCCLLQDGRDNGVAWFRVWNTPLHIQEAVERIFEGREEKLFRYEDPESFEERSVTPENALVEYSHGDGGVFVVDCRDFTWRNWDGYKEGED